MGNMVSSPINITLASDDTQDIWSLMAPSGNKLVLHGWELTSNVVVASALDVDLHFISDFGTGGVVVTGVNLDRGNSSNVVGSIRTQDTTPGAPDGFLYAYQWEQLGPVGHVFTPEMRPKTDVLTGIALTCNTAATPTLAGWVCWEEI